MTSTIRVARMVDAELPYCFRLSSILRCKRTGPRVLQSRNTLQCTKPLSYILHHTTKLLRHIGTCVQSRQLQRRLTALKNGRRKKPIVSIEYKSARCVRCATHAPWFWASKIKKTKGGEWMILTSCRYCCHYAEMIIMPYVPLLYCLSP